MDPDEDNRLWHEEMRCKDAEDIAAGRRTPEQVNRDNAWIPNFQDWKPTNLIEATCAL